MRRESGVTLVELMAALAIGAIVAMLGIPAYSGMVEHARLSSATNTLVATLSLARSEAIKRNSRVTLCKSQSGLACLEAGDWAQGWLVFHDANDNAAWDTGEAIIWRQTALPDGYRIRGNESVSSYVSYSSSGATIKVSGAFQAGTLTVCKEMAGPAQARQVVIASTGRVRIQTKILESCT